jgi:hypothetical protein
VLVWFRYHLERLVGRRSLGLVVVMCGTLCAVALLGGLLARLAHPEHFTTYQSAVWWAVLRLSDTGYLSDEIDSLEIRGLSMALSIVGMAVTVGGIVAVVSQQMHRFLGALASGTTPVPFSRHTVLIGWNDRTPQLLSLFLASDSRPIVLLVEDIVHARSRLASLGLSPVELDRVILRAGFPYRPHELSRAGCARAEVVIMAASARAIAGDAEEDPRIVRTTYALSELLRDQNDERPIVALEIVERSLLPLVQSVLPRARVLASDRIVARVLRLVLQQRGLVAFAIDLLTPHSGLRIEACSFPELTGLPLGSLRRQVTGGRVLGVLSKEGNAWTSLDMMRDRVLCAGEKVMVFHDGTVRIEQPEDLDAPPMSMPMVPRSRRFEAKKRRILVLGWNEAGADVIGAFSHEPSGRYEVDVISRAPAAIREQAVLSHAWPGRVQVTHREADPLSVEFMPERELASYDRFLILADRSGNPETADVRSLAIAMALEQRFSSCKPGAYGVLELLQDNHAIPLPHFELITTPRIVAQVLESMTSVADRDNVLGLTLDHHMTFVTRAALAPNVSEELLAMELRHSGLALLSVIETPAGPVAVFAEPVRAPQGLVEIAL